MSNKHQGSHISGIAREDAAAVAPRVVVEDASDHVPAVADPADVDGAEHAVHVLHIEDVGVAVREQLTIFAVRLRKEKRPDIREGGRDLRLTTEHRDDLAVAHRPIEPENLLGIERNFRDDISRKPGGEVVSTVGDLHARLLREERSDGAEHVRRRRLVGHERDDLVG